MKTQSNPTQYDFSKNWDTEIRPLFKKSKIKKNVDILRNLYVDFIEGEMFIAACENSPAHNPSEYKMKIRQALACCYELNWLRGTFEGSDLIFIVNSIACELYPSKEWHILEFGVEDAIITDKERSIVFDIKNFDLLSGGASLALSGDVHFAAPREVIEEVYLFREARLQREIEKLEKIKAHIKELRDAGKC